MSVSRGNFLKSLGKSIPGMIMGGGVATAAQTLLSRMAGAEQNVPPGLMVKAVPQPVKKDFIRSGPAAGNRIALTFDDGPTPGVTDLILGALKERGLRATFFMIGNRISAAPDLARRVLAEGHEVGNHTFTHANLTILPEAKAEREIQDTQELMAHLLNYQPSWFRPPFGALRQNQAHLAEGRGLRIVLWEADSRDWSQPGEGLIAEKIFAQTRAGSIILCHDLYQQTAHAMPRILDGLLERGLTFSSLSELLRR